MGVNQVYYGDSPLVDLTGDTVTPETLLQGETAHNAAGNRITGIARPESLLKDTVGWTGKNLLKNTASSQTINGVTFTVNADGSITVNGTATANIIDYFINKFTNDYFPYDTSKEYILSGCPAGGSSNGYRLDIVGESGIVFSVDDIGNGAIFQFPKVPTGTERFSARIRIGNGTVCNNVVFYPMIRRADIIDDTYEPYHESVEVMYEEEIHGVNFIKNTASTQTINGVTFTVNSDGSVTVNGTATRTFTLDICTRADNSQGQSLRGDFVASIGATKIPDGGNFSLQKNNLSSYWDMGTSRTEMVVKFTDSEYWSGRVHIFFANGSVWNNIRIYPMLRKADIEDSIYRPYNPQAIQNQLNAQTGILGAKNLLNHVLTSQTSDGVTINVDDKKIITLNGTSTSDFTVILLPKEDLNALLAKYGNLILNGSDPVKYTDARIITKSGSYIIDNGTGILLDASKTYENNLSLQIFNGKTFNNLKIKPMLRLASDPDDTYQPYAMTNRELTKKVFEKRTLTSADDLNNITETGIYGITTAPVNSPEATTYCTLLVKANSSNDIKQIIFEARSAGGYIYIRSYGNNVWGSWYKFTGTVVS